MDAKWALIWTVASGSTAAAAAALARVSDETLLEPVEVLTATGKTVTTTLLGAVVDAMSQSTHSRGFGKTQLANLELVLARTPLTSSGSPGIASPLDMVVLNRRHLNLANYLHGRGFELSADGMAAALRWLMLGHSRKWAQLLRGVVPQVVMDYPQTLDGAIHPAVAAWVLRASKEADHWEAFRNVHPYADLLFATPALEAFFAVVIRGVENGCVFEGPPALGTEHYMPLAELLRTAGDIDFFPAVVTNWDLLPDSSVVLSDYARWAIQLIVKSTTRTTWRWGK